MLLFVFITQNAPPLDLAVFSINFVLMKTLFFASSSTFIAPPFFALLFMNVELSNVLFNRLPKMFIAPPSTLIAELLLNMVFL